MNNEQKSIIKNNMYTLTFVFVFTSVVFLVINQLGSIGFGLTHFT